MSHERTGSGQAGFTLVELLVVVIVIGVLAAIAIPSYLSQRETAYLGAMRSDLRNAASTQAGLVASDGELADGLEPLRDVGFRVSNGVSFTNDGSFTSHPSGLCMQVEHDAMPGEPWSLSAEGNAVPEPGPC